ncbi:DUF4405 domain-containing protein [Methanoculleus frigidifontis]|uniref:DUF4405 domain-containing protein n=1 Tax=Methanoculleus frigidifontis TaxID=2584085 RepID=UPI003463E147
MFLGIARSGWQDLHNAASLIFAAFVVVHLLLRWRYLRGFGRIFSRASGTSDRGRNLLGAHGCCYHRRAAEMTWFFPGFPGFAALE